MMIMMMTMVRELVVFALFQLFHRSFFVSVCACTHLPHVSRNISIISQCASMMIFAGRVGQVQ